MGIPYEIRTLVASRWLSAGRSAGEIAWASVRAEGDGQHPLVRVETEREVSGTGLAEPEVFAAAELAPAAFEIGVEVGGKSFCEEQLSFT